MTDVLFAAAGLVLATVAVGLVRVLRGPRAVDSIMAVQLFGTGGVAVLLLLGAASGVRAIVDVALTLALLSAFVSIAYVKFFTGASLDVAGNQPERDA